MFSEDSKCKKCGECTRKCPMGIEVHKIIQTLEKDKNAGVNMHQSKLCIQCGACTYHCRAGKNIMEAVVGNGVK